MPKMTDYVALWEKYQREGVPQKIPIERFCVMNGYTYKQFEQWYKTDRNFNLDSAISLFRKLSVFYVWTYGNT